MDENKNTESPTQNEEPVESVAVAACNPSTMDTTQKDDDIPPAEIETAKAFLLKFAKEYERNSQYPCRRLYDCMNDLRIEHEFAEAQKNMTPSEIYNDATQLFQCGLHLLNNYSENWKKANELIETMMRRHYPKLQRRIDKVHYSKKDQSKLVYGDIDTIEE